MAAVLDIPQIIEPDALYVTTEAKRRLSMGEWAWRKFRIASELKQVRIGSKCYVKGSEIIAATERLAAKQASQKEAAPAD